MTWSPRSGNDEIDGMIWLPRLIDKARRVANTPGTPYLIGEYTFGENDPPDAAVLRFLRVSSAELLQAVQAEPDNDAAARKLLRESGRSSRECAGFTRKFRLVQAPFLAMMEADEGRMPPGAAASFLRWLYNAVLMPLVYAYFRRKEQRL